MRIQIISAFLVTLECFFPKNMPIFFSFFCSRSLSQSGVSEEGSRLEKARAGLALSTERQRWIFF